MIDCGYGLVELCTFQVVNGEICKATHAVTELSFSEQIPGIIHHVFKSLDMQLLDEYGFVAEHRLKTVWCDPSFLRETDRNANSGERFSRTYLPQKTDNVFILDGPSAGEVLSADMTRRRQSVYLPDGSEYRIRTVTEDSNDTLKLGVFTRMVTAGRFVNAARI